MATHSSILAWRISWTEEPRELPSMGSQRVWVTKHTRVHLYAFYIYIYIHTHIYIVVCCLVAKLCLTVLQPHGLDPTLCVCVCVCVCKIILNLVILSKDIYAHISVYISTYIYTHIYIKYTVDLLILGNVYIYIK